MFVMPREASKRNNWEKERRERFNRTFDELAKILPSYHPSITINRIDVLKEAIITITEFKKEISRLSESPEEAKTYKDELVKKLQDRIKKLIIRNEQLVKLFQNAGIKIPRKKSKVEKENKPATPLTKKSKLSKNQEHKQSSKTRNTSQPKKFPKKNVATNNLLLFSRLSTVPVYNQQFVLVPNPPVVNNSHITTVVAGPQKKLKTKKTASSTKVPKIIPPPSSLGPGTLILANGNIISVAPQPQMLVPPSQTITSKPMVNPALQSIKIPPRVNLSLNPQSAINLGVKIKPVNVSNYPKITSKDCLTRTTQVNKVPIPAFTSKYGNSSLLLKNQTNRGKKVKKIESNNKSNAVKRKIDEKSNTTTKKRRTCRENNKQMSTVNKESTESKEEQSTTTVDSIKTVEKLNEVQDNSEIIENNIDQSKDVTKNSEEHSSNVNNKEKTSPTIHIVTNINLSESIPPVPIIQNENSELLNTTTTISASTTSSSTPSSIVTNATTITSVQDMNLDHSDLSNDIFASLQVPSGCQNMESTSPTAAFLLTFPLVSSIKVTDENSDSQKETPTLLQIGNNIETSKPSENDSLLNLDNFSFFNSKDIYYSSKMDEKNVPESDTLLEQKVEEPSINTFPVPSKELSLDKNNLVVHNSDDNVPNVDERECRSNKPETFGDIQENEEKERSCLKEKSSSSVTIQKSEAVSNKIDGKLVQNGSINFPTDQQQNKDNFSCTPKSPTETIKENENNKGNEYNDNSFRKLEETQNNLKDSNVSKSYLNEFIPNIKSYDFNVSKIPESYAENTTNFYSLEKTTEQETFEKKTYQTLLTDEFQFSSKDPKKPVKNVDENLKQFEHFDTKIPEQNLDSSETNKTYSQNFSLNSAKMPEESDTLKSYQYNPKLFEGNLNFFLHNPSKTTKHSRNTLEKSDSDKNYYYDAIHFSSLGKLPGKSDHTVEDSVGSKSCNYNLRQVELDLNTLESNSKEKHLELTDKNKIQYYNETNFSLNVTNVPDKSKNVEECNTYQKQVELKTFEADTKKDKETSGGKLEHPTKTKTFDYNNTTNFASVSQKISDKSVTKTCQYNSKQIDYNLKPLTSNSSEITEQKLVKTDSSKTLYYNMANFSLESQSKKVLEKSEHLEKPIVTKSCHYTREFELNKTFEPNISKIPESLEKSDNTKSYYCNANKLSSNPEKYAENLEDTKISQYNPKQFVVNFSTNLTKISETPEENLENKNYYYNKTNFSSNAGRPKALEESDAKSCQYNLKPNFNSFAPNSVKIPEMTGQNVDKSYYYNNRSNFSLNSENMAEKSADNVSKKTCHYNPKQFELNLNTFVPNASKNLENPTQQNLGKLDHYNSTVFCSTSSKISEKSCQYNPRMIETNLNTFEPISTKVPPVAEHFKNPEENKTFFYNTSNFPSKNLEKSDQLEECVNTKSCQYIKQAENNAFAVKNPQASSQNLEKPDVKKSYYYDETNFSSNIAKIPEKNENLGELNVSKSCHYNTPKQFEDHFTPNAIKVSEQIQEKSDSNKTYYYNISTFSTNTEKASKDLNESLKTYQYNPFEVVPTPKEISLNDKAKVVDTNKLEVCSKPTDEKSCYFSSNYTSASYRPTTCSYENKQYTNPFYSNCNYTHSYPDNNFNQNYYKTDSKPNYSLNYESYQEYRRTDGSYAREKKTSKEKQIQQNKPVNWMTTEQKPHTSDCFLPSFTNQSYSFTSCITTDAMDNLGDGKKTTEAIDKRFTWSPSKLPNFLEPAHNFITPTLPTLVGDLALGNSLPLTDPKYSKEVKRKTYENQANFLSVSQLVSQNKNESTPARTVSRRISGSKTKNVSSKKRSDKISKNVSFNDVYYDQKSRPSAKIISSNYSAEALIGNQCPQEDKKIQQTNKMCTNFLTENIVTFFTTAEDTFMNQNQNLHTYTHNSFQNNSCCSNNFIYSTPSITSTYLTNHFENTGDYSAENIVNYGGVKDNKQCGSKNYRMTNKDDKNINCSSSSIKKNKKGNTNLGSFDYPLLPIGSTNSPILPDDFQSHTTFLAPTTPYNCKNTLYQKPGSDFNTAPLLPLPGITRGNIQHPEISPSLNPAGTSLTNFNLSTIFPEINKGSIPNVQSSSDNKVKTSSNYLDNSFNAESKYGYTG